MQSLGCPSELFTWKHSIVRLLSLVCINTLCHNINSCYVWGMFTLYHNIHSCFVRGCSRCITTFTAVMLRGCYVLTDSFLGNEYINLETLLKRHQSAHSFWDPWAMGFNCEKAEITGVLPTGHDSVRCLFVARSPFS